MVPRPVNFHRDQKAIQIPSRRAGLAGRPDPNEAIGGRRQPGLGAPMAAAEGISGHVSGIKETEFTWSQ